MEQTIRSDQYILVLLDSWYLFCFLKHIPEVVLIRFIRPNVLCREDRSKFEAMLELCAGVHKGVVVHVGEDDEVIMFRELLEGRYGIREGRPIGDGGGKRFGLGVSHLDL